MEHQDWKPVDIGRGKSVKKVSKKILKSIIIYLQLRVEFVKMKREEL